MASKTVGLTWTGEGQHFRGVEPDRWEVSIDGSGKAGPSPMDALLLSLAGCMAADVLMILERSRVPVEALEIEVHGERAETPPRRYTELRMEYRVRGPAEEDRPKLERAVQLSRERYCSVIHTLRQDLDLQIEIRRL